MPKRLQAKCPLFLSDFNEIWIFSTYFRKVPNIKSRQNLSSGSRVVPCGQTDRKLIVAFCNFVNAPEKLQPQHHFKMSAWSDCVLGPVEAQLVETLHRKTECPEFDFWWGPWKFSSDVTLLSACNRSAIDSASNRHEYRGIYLVVKCGRCVESTLLDVTNIKVRKEAQHSIPFYGRALPLFFTVRKSILPPHKLLIFSNA
jgi:hypothetical protein